MANKEAVPGRPDQQNPTPCDFPDADQIIAGIFSASVLGIAIFDDQLRFRAINKALADMNGVPVEAHFGKTVSEVLGPAARQVEPKLELVFATGETVSFELAAQLPTRTEMGYWAVRCFPVKDQQGRVKRVCTIVTELTKMRALGISLFGLSRKLLALNAAVKRNIGGLVGANDRANDKSAPPTLLAVNLLDYCVAEIIAISKLPDSPVSEITPEVLKQYDSLFSAEVSKSFLRMSQKSPVGCLPRREREVVQYLAEGKSNKEIAVSLGLSVKTVETYRARIMLKLNAHSVTDLVRYAVRCRLVEV